MTPAKDDMSQRLDAALAKAKRIVAEHDATEYDAWKCSECGLKNVYYRKTCVICKTGRI